MTYQLNPTAWGWGGYTGFFWAGSGALCAVWVWFRLPETKGRSFRELGKCQLDCNILTADILFERGVPARKFASTYIDPNDES